MLKNIIRKVLFKLAYVYYISFFTFRSELYKVYLSSMLLNQRTKF